MLLPYILYRAIAGVRDRELTMIISENRARSGQEPDVRLQEAQE